MRWMKLEPIVQSEIRQKEKHHYSINSVQFSRSVMSNSLWPHESQNTRPPCPGVHSNSRPSSRWCHPAISSSFVLFSSCPNHSQHQGLFQWVNSSHEVAKYWSFSSSIIPSKEYPGLISFKMDWLDLLAVQGTLKSLLQHHSSKASILFWGNWGYWIMSWVSEDTEMIPMNMLILKDVTGA